MITVLTCFSTLAIVYQLWAEVRECCFFVMLVGIGNNHTDVGEEK